ncbi:MAG: Proposed peptidoglycan lipid II flippase MurJ, partial [uncultured Gemmatimonadaceae bacterium]
GGSRATRRRGGGTRRRGDPREQAVRLGTGARVRVLPGELPLGRRLPRGVPDSEHPAEPVRRGRSLGVVHPGVREPTRAGRRGGGTAARRRGAHAPRARHRRARRGRRPLRAATRAARPGGVRARHARPHGPAHPDPLPGCRAVRALGLVPGRAEQPSPVLPLVRRARRVERRDDRRARGVRTAPHAAGARARARGGLGGGRAAGAAGAAARRAAAGGRGAAPARCPQRGRPRGGAELRARVRESGRRADQQLRGPADRGPRRGRRRVGDQLRAGDLHAPGEPVRHRDRGGGAAGAFRGRRRGGGGRGAARPPRRGAAAGGVLHRAVGGRVRRDRRRDRLAPVPERRVRRARRRVGLADPGRLGGRPPRGHARPPLRVHLLRAPRLAHAAALRARARRPHARARAARGGVPPTSTRRRPSVGRGGAELRVGDGRVGGVRAAAARARTADRRHGAARGLLRAPLGGRGCRGGGRVGGQAGVARRRLRRGAVGGDGGRVRRRLRRGGPGGGRPDRGRPVGSCGARGPGPPPL